jgi:hypothetical protein
MVRQLQETDHWIFTMFDSMTGQMRKQAQYPFVPAWLA